MMKASPAVLLLCTLPLLKARAQGGTGSETSRILAERQVYKEAFLKDAHSPLTAADTADLRFFDAAPEYIFTADVKETPGSKVFNMPTHNGKTKRYQVWGTATFRKGDTSLTLHIYRSPDLAKREDLKDHLFIPFNDATNEALSYGGGRYLDLKTGDIKNGRLVLDFNRCYNPYCAFKEGYSCPVPPAENRLPVHIEAGEKRFGRTSDDHD